jgi:hypothetical protein
MKCRYSHPGTWGHECGAPATLMQLGRGESTIDGRYWYIRCDKCIAHTGPDNHGLSRTGWVPYDPSIAVNKWK